MNAARALLLAPFLLTASPLLAQQYTIADIGPYNAYVSRINTSGQAIFFGPPGSFYSNNTSTPLPTFGGTASNPFGLNDAGTVVGQSNDSNGFWYAFSYTPATGLTLLPGTAANTVAYGINNTGQILFATPAGTFLRNPNNSTITIPNIANGYSTLNASGQVAGTSNAQARLFTAGITKPLGFLSSGNQSEAYDLNDSGAVVGNSNLATGGSTYHAFLYRNNAMLDLGIADGDRSFAFGINNPGDIVGTIGRTSDTYAFLYHNNALLDLNSLIDPASNWSLQQAYDINDSGQIIGYGLHNGATRTYILTPTPEPASLSLLLLASPLLLHRRCNSKANPPFRSPPSAAAAATGK